MFGKRFLPYLQVSDTKRKTLRIVTLSLIFIASIETMYILFELNKAPHTNPYLSQILAHRKIIAPESGHDIYEDLETIGCSVRQLESFPHHWNLYLTDYSAFLILAEGKEVTVNQGFHFSWEPLVLFWDEDISLYAETRYGVIKWEATYSSYEFISGRTRRETDRRGILRPMEIVTQMRLFESIEHQLSKSDGMLLGIFFLQDLGYHTGKSTSTTFETREPNYYWHEIGGLEKPDIQGKRECWVFKSFLPTGSPFGRLEIWVDADTGIIIGGSTS